MNEEKRWGHIKEQLGGSLWIFAYLIFISVLSYIGSRELNGIGLIKYPWDYPVLFGNRKSVIID